MSQIRGCRGPLPPVLLALVWRSLGSERRGPASAALPRAPPRPDPADVRDSGRRPCFTPPRCKTAAPGPVP